MQKHKLMYCFLAACGFFVLSYNRTKYIITYKNVFQNAKKNT